MPMEHVCKWSIVIVYTVLSIYYCAYFMNNDKIVCNGKIGTIANKDLYYLGTYSFRTKVSIKHWVYAMAIAAYKAGKSDNIFDTFILWNDEYNFDPVGFISEGIDWAKTDFLDTLQKAKDNNESPRFPVASGYDYHDYPLSFNYNDYVDCESLISMIDEILEVK